MQQYTLSISMTTVTMALKLEMSASVGSKLLSASSLFTWLLQPTWESVSVCGGLSHVSF